MRLIFILFFFLLFLTREVYSIDPEEDTIRLEGITIQGQYFDGYNAGSRVQKIDSLKLAGFRSGNLNDLIKSSSPVYFKSYGSSMLSSVSFRGTGAGHTAILWNGIQVNQPTIGQSDFSLFPVYAFDEIRIHYGASSARYGSDAIGGGIQLRSNPDWNTGRISGSTGFMTGSYGKYIGLGELNFRASENLLSNTRVYYNSNRNDFKYSNFTRAGNPVERQKNASVNQHDIMQDIYLKTVRNGLLSINSWYHLSEREIQPTMTNTDAADTQKDKNFKLSANYGLDALGGEINTKLAYLYDYLLYNKQSEIIINQYLSDINYDRIFSDWKVVGGLNYRFITAESGNYPELKKETRLSLFGGTVYQGIRNTELSFNLRQLFVRGYTSPLSPSLGVRYNFYLDHRNSLVIDGQLSLNYRVPTLNERYWEPGGKADLLPEISKNMEGSISYMFDGFIDLKLGVNTFYYLVDDWIMWIPGQSYWYPENIRNVNSSGVELFYSFSMRYGLSEFKLSGYYSYTKSVIRKSGLENDPGLGNQLPYTPLHLAAINFEWNYKNWYAGMFNDYTGIRYVTTDNLSELPAFYLMNFRAGKNFQWKNHLFSIDLRIDNVLDTGYQNVQFRAMPGRTYTAGINYFINP